MPVPTHVPEASPTVVGSLRSSAVSIQTVLLTALVAGVTLGGMIGALLVLRLRAPAQSSAGAPAVPQRPLFAHAVKPVLAPPTASTRDLQPALDRSAPADRRPASAPESAAVVAPHDIAGPAAPPPAPTTEASATGPEDSPAAPPPLAMSRPPPMGDAGVTDVQIGQAITRGTDFLLAHFHEGKLTVGDKLSRTHLEALEALCVYALAQSGQAIRDPRLDIHGKELPRMIERLKAAAFN